MEVIIPPRYALARVVQHIPPQSAKALKAEIPFFERCLFCQGRRMITRLLCNLHRLGKKILAYLEHQENENKG